ncbi:hypothetical protein CFC35_25020 [Streptomyces sp. FBKL.4005]|uniref:Lipoprotein n=1 Tax=Streptomyces tricolor TaxID=68277 RepID=A0ABS9JP84_9ACTN|nr:MULTISPECIES: hypothetical protein [Streptomyces]MCG0067399.1 hypothetical protein [Streptomyces tricolor]OYP17362.1 hypothetical protein CFC35_25020 [Streptomyces sp. FBKL.4005]
MRRTTPFALTAAALLLAGCGSQEGTGSSDKVSAPPRGGTQTPSPGRSAGDCTGQAELTAADHGRTVCVTEGGEVRLTLDGTRARPWKPVTASGGGLEAINAGFVLQPGDATAAYRAVAAGTVRLTSSRPLCAQPTAPGQVSCKGIEEWTVTVRVE